MPADPKPLSWPMTFDKGFAPDLDPRTPGIFVDCDQFYPTSSGYRPFAQLAAATTQGMPAPAMGSYFVEYSDLSDIIFLGTAQKLYQFILTGGNSIYTDISNGQQFNVVAPNRWRYTTFGNDTIAVDGFDPPQLIVKGSKIAKPIVGAPVGSIVESVGNFVFIFNTTGVGNDWNCCAIGNDQSWAPDIGTQAANGILGDTPGPITAAKALGQNNILVYKAHATYLGQYQGPPIIWSFTLLSGEAGALSQEAVITDDGIQSMIGSGSFYSCDGSPPRVLDNPLRKFFFETSYQPAFGAPLGTWDKFHDLFMWFYQTGAPHTPVQQSRYICWHRTSNRWMTGLYQNLIQDVIRPYVRVNSTGAMSVPLGSGQVVPYYGMAVLLVDNNIYSFSGEEAPAYVVTGDQGDSFQYTQITSVRPAFKVFPEGSIPQVGTQQPTGNPAVCTPLRREYLGGPQTADSEAQLNQQGFFPLRSDGRYHALKIEVFEDCELMGADVDYDLTGVR